MKRGAFEVEVMRATGLGWSGASPATSSVFVAF
jgi:hypothetical protein